MCPLDFPGRLAQAGPGRWWLACTLLADVISESETDYRLSQSESCVLSSCTVYQPGIPSLTYSTEYIQTTQHTTTHSILRTWFSLPHIQGNI